MFNVILSRHTVHMEMMPHMNSTCILRHVVVVQRVGMLRDDEAISTTSTVSNLKMIYFC